MRTKDANTSFSDSFIQSLPLPRKEDKPNQVPYFERLEEGLGLRLLVSYGGAKSWSVVTYDDASKAVYTPIGKFNPGAPWHMNVKAAKARAREIWAKPLGSEQKELGKLSFIAVCDLWHEEVSKGQHRREHQTKRLIALYFGESKFANTLWYDMRRAQCSDLLASIKTKHGKNVARMCAVKLQTIQKWFRGVKDENYNVPMSAEVIKQADNRTIAQRSRDHALCLDDDGEYFTDEIKRLLRAIERPIVFHDLVLSCLLTAQRSRKVAEMKWADLKQGAVLINGESKLVYTWKIPHDAGEKHTPKSLQLPWQLSAIIARQRRIEANPYVFCGREGQCFAAFGVSKARLDERLIGVRPWRIHDLRRTARTMMAHLKVTDAVAEKCLGHSLGSQVERIYQKYDFRKDMAAALQLLADHIDDIRVRPISAASVESVRLAA